MYIEEFDKFLQTVPLKDYRKKYSSIKIVEMDLPKDIQAIELLYKVYWDEKKFISFDDFYKRYLKEKKETVKKFKIKTTMCDDCFKRGLKARIYRTQAGLITQIHGGYVAESVFGEGDSYTRGMLVYSETELNVFTDRSVDARSVSASSFTFDGVVTDNAIYVATFY